MSNLNFDPDKRVPDIANLLDREDVTADHLLEVLGAHALSGCKIDAIAVIKLSEQLDLNMTEMYHLKRFAEAGIEQVEYADMISHGEHIAGYSAILGYAKFSIAVFGKSPQI